MQHSVGFFYIHTYKGKVAAQKSIESPYCVLIFRRKSWVVSKSWRFSLKDASCEALLRFMQLHTVQSFIALFSTRANMSTLPHMDRQLIRLQQRIFGICLLNQMMVWGSEPRSDIMIDLEGTLLKHILSNFLSFELHLSWITFIGTWWGYHSYTNIPLPPLSNLPTLHQPSNLPFPLASFLFHTWDWWRNELSFPTETLPALPSSFGIANFPKEMD